MKQIKMMLPVAALLVSSLAFGQKGKSTVKVSTTTRTQTSVSNKAKDAEWREKGTVSANANASETAKRVANENSVLNSSPVHKKRKYNSKRRHRTH